MHARVEFYVNLEVRDTGFGGFGSEFLQFVQREDRRLEPIAEKSGVVGCDGVEHHYWHRDASATQLNTFVNDSHSQICRALGLEGLGNLERTGTVGRGLDHTYKPGVGSQQRTVIIIVVYYSIEVYLKDGVVARTFESSLYAAESIKGFAGNQNGFG